MTHAVDRAEHFIWLTARALEQRRFTHQFLEPDAGGVEAALCAYLRPDGGFGYALEPDLRGPAPQPLHAAFALRVLEETGTREPRFLEPLIEHLAGLSGPDGGLPAVHPGQRGYPSSAALTLLDEPPGALLSTGTVVGLLHRLGVAHPWLERATEFCWNAVENLGASHPYEVEAAVTFLDGVPHRSRAEEAAQRLGEAVRQQRMFVTEPHRAGEFPLSGGYGPGEYHFPYNVARTPDSLARAWFSEQEMDEALDFLAAEQEADGGWPILWHEWAPGTRLEWRPIITLESLRTLRAYGRLG